MEKKETAVEWLAEHLCNEMNFDFWKAVEKAKQMEKEQIIQAANNGCKGRCMIDNTTDGKQYYNETYGGTK
jgi:hypothetical protein